MVWPLPVERKPSDLAWRLAELEGLVREAARSGLPAHEVERSLWSSLLRLGHELRVEYLTLAGDGDRGETLVLADGRVIRRLPEAHSRPYQSIFGEFVLERVVYGTREGQRIEAVPLDARLGLPAEKFSYLLQDWDQALAVENPYGQVNAVLARILGFKQSVASLETMTRTLAVAVSGHKAARPPVARAKGAQIVVLSADGKGVPIRKPADAPAIAAHDHARGPKPNRKKMAVLGAAYHIKPSVRTPLAVVETLFRDPAAPARASRTEPPRPVPQQKQLCAVLPVAGTAAALGRMGAFHELLHPRRNRAPLCEHPDQTSIHPASPRCLNQRRARLVTPNCVTPTTISARNQVYKTSAHSSRTGDPSHSLRSKVNESLQDRWPFRPLSRYRRASCVIVDFAHQ